MDTETRKALEASIAKWRQNAEAKTPRDYKTGPSVCPLCNLFWDLDCIGCPVKDHTGKPYCDDSPYNKAEKARDKWNLAMDELPDDEVAALADHARKAAAAEVEFLESLRPSDPVIRTAAEQVKEGE